MITYRRIFSRAALAARKSLEYAATAFEARETDLLPLRNSLVERTALFETTVGPIRHKVFAHAGNITSAEMFELFQNVPRADYEKLSTFPLDLHDALFQLYYNGERPVGRLIESDLATLVGNSARRS